MAGVVSGVKANSVAAKAGLQVGDKLLRVNGSEPQDLIALSFLLAETDLLLEWETKAGKQLKQKVAKGIDEDLGLEFTSAVFDEVATCANKCKFCFVDQMIPGLRSSLYVRDDDYRLSYLYGNFITLTNMQEDDYARIIREHLSPLYVSVHATDGLVRQKMMKNKYAGQLMQCLHKLLDAGIEIHTQIVLCPGYNDGAVLEKTFQDLVKLYPAVQTMAVVPVGLTKNRKGLPRLRIFTQAEAKKIVQTVSKWQSYCRQKYHKSFIYLGDEFYVLAGEAMPGEAYYDGFPQLENGIGLSRNFLAEWEKTKTLPVKNIETAFIPVGESAAKVLAPIIENFNKQYATKHRLLAVKNAFFGPKVNVTGLLTACDIIKALKEENLVVKKVLLPAVVLNSDNLFLDGVSLAAFKKSLPEISVLTVHTATELKTELSR